MPGDSPTTVLASRFSFGPQEARPAGCLAKTDDADERQEEALAACLVHDGLVPILAEMSPEHFDNDLHRHLRAHLVDEGEAEADLVPLIAELDARAAADAIDEATGKRPLAAVAERKLRRELAAADLEHTKEAPRSNSRRYARPSKPLATGTATIRVRRAPPVAQL